MDYLGKNIGATFYFTTPAAQNGQPVSLTFQGFDLQVLSGESFSINTVGFFGMAINSIHIGSGDLLTDAPYIISAVPSVSELGQSGIFISQGFSTAHSNRLLLFFTKFL